MDVAVEITGVEESRKKIGALLSRERLTAMNSHVGSTVLDFFRDHLDQMAPSRHKCADRLGAKPTHHFEYASGRVGNSNGQSTDVESLSAQGFTIAIRNTPGLLRAFGPVTVRPKRAKWLTIPIHKDAYGKSVKDLRNEGRVIFRPGKARILAESETYSIGRGKSKTKATRLRPLYALCTSTTAPKDSGLLPTKEKMVQTAVEAAEDFLLTE